MRKLADDLYVYESTCQVYVRMQGKQAVLIDFGDGTVLDELAAIGAEQVAGILMTHHHRDQGQGLPRAVEAGIPIYVPHTEQELFSGIDESLSSLKINRIRGAIMFFTLIR
ncbi:MBL fold metallo-hydrolase [Paenibacillus alkaliterrae]|uniref:MBL fold metallo-hydrolase n=1 Tax=Paenibacillus alkaliterrae TaxID=320909 RepID=UPI001F24533C|nr:MBL fold metallo-hydrolase [Paenibacillus alkaliterrae]MCF2937946.1 MBL fold metallo-hydrolase [Paenibacillus alkaliterrae]